MSNDAAVLRSFVSFPGEHSQAESTRPMLIHASREPAKDAVWLAYLRSLPDKRTVSFVVANNAERIWRYLRPLANNIAIPDAAVTEGGGLFMSWDRGKHHLEIELLPNGRYEWFYRNRSTDAFAGEYNYPATTVLPPALLAQFRLVAENA
jgi:hypothetical protein